MFVTRVIACCVIFRPAHPAMLCCNLLLPHPAQVPSDSVFVTRFMGGYTENVPPDEFDALPVRCTAPSCWGSYLFSTWGSHGCRLQLRGGDCALGTPLC